ncbi:MAG: hypothetical protein M3O91_02675 [Chloroflexota bacterium]|nr:hypothetical protein [Chloroflexota bacterium]
MLARLGRLLHPYPAAGPRALAPAVYADAQGHLVPASDRGFEGVACVDDAARALVLYCDLWNATGAECARDCALGLLDFVLWMQEPDGRFLNFVRDWDGTRNLDGPTSFAGGSFWHARAVRGLAKAWTTFGGARVRAAIDRALPYMETAGVNPDVGAVHVLAALDLAEDDADGRLRSFIERRSDEIAGCRDGDVLANYPGEPLPHLWGHLQEGVLAEASRYLGRADLLDAARASAHALLEPVIQSSFALPRVEPYGVAAVVYGMDRLHQVTGSALYAELAALARAWFDGRNAAGVPAYDRAAGAFRDGIDEGRLNPNSGAESNIVGAQALLAEVAAWLTRDPRGCFPPRIT